MRFLITAAEAGGSAVDPGSLQFWINLGTLGVFTWLWLSGRIVRGSELEQIRKERDQERQRNTDIEVLMREEFLPALLDARGALQKTNDAVLPTLARVQAILESRDHGPRQSGW